MTTLKITRSQFDLIVETIEQASYDDRAYVNEHGEKRAGEAFVKGVKELEHLSNLFEVYENGNNTKINIIEIVE